MHRLRELTAELLTEVTRGDVRTPLAEEIRALTITMQGAASLHLADLRQAGDLLTEAMRLAGRPAWPVPRSAPAATWRCGTRPPASYGPPSGRGTR